ASDQAVGVLHLVDRLGALVLGQLLVAPVVVHPAMQEVLVDRDQFVAQHLVEVLDDLGVALHGGFLVQRRATRARRPRLYRQRPHSRLSWNVTPRKGVLTLPPKGGKETRRHCDAAFRNDRSSTPQRAGRRPGVRTRPRFPPTRVPRLRNSRSRWSNRFALAPFRTYPHPARQ